MNEARINRQYQKTRANGIPTPPYHSRLGAIVGLEVRRRASPGVGTLSSIPAGMVYVLLVLAMGWNSGHELYTDAQVAVMMVSIYTALAAIDLAYKTRPVEPLLASGAHRCELVVGPFLAIAYFVAIRVAVIVATLQAAFWVASRHNPQIVCLPVGTALMLFVVILSTVLTYVTIGAVGPVVPRLIGTNWDIKSTIIRFVGWFLGIEVLFNAVAYVTRTHWGMLLCPVLNAIRAIDAVYYSAPGHVGLSAWSYEPAWFVPGVLIWNSVVTIAMLAVAVRVMNRASTE
jgi:hypothetical protein